jgi:hypothetical protein
VTYRNLLEKHWQLDNSRIEALILQLVVWQSWWMFIGESRSPSGESRRQVVAFTNVLKLVSNRKGIDARAWWYMSKQAEAYRKVPNCTD